MDARLNGVLLLMDGEIVMVESVPEPAARIISTKGKPFHFHIPILDEHPEKDLPLAQLVEIAKKYKNPLTLDPVIYKAAVLGKILTEKELENMKRTERDSATMDFLNIPMTTDDEAGDGSDSSRERAEEDVYLMGGKRSVIHVSSATDEVLQELLGDTDDLKILAQASSSETATTITKKPDTTSKPGKIPTSTTAAKTTRPSKATNKPKPKKASTTNRPTASTAKVVRPARDDYFADAEDAAWSSEEQARHLKRSKRGLGKWLKKVFGFGKTTTTTKATTTRAPKPPPSPPPQLRFVPGDIIPSAGGQQGIILIHLNQNNTAGKGVSGEPDANGDTEVDFLLPVDLRRSTWLKNHPQD